MLLFKKYPKDFIIYLYSSSAKAEYPEEKEYEGYVHQVEDSSIIVGFSPKLRNRFVANMKFNIRFTFNRFPIRNMHRAAEFISGKPEMKSFVFPTCSPIGLQGIILLFKI